MRSRVVTITFSASAIIPASRDCIALADIFNAVSATRAGAKASSAPSLMRFSWLLPCKRTRRWDCSISSFMRLAKVMQAFAFVISLF